VKTATDHKLRKAQGGGAGVPGDITSVLGLWKKGGVGMKKRMGAVFGRVKFGLRISTKSKTAPGEYVAEEGYEENKQELAHTDAVALHKFRDAPTQNPAKLAWGAALNGQMEGPTDNEGEQTRRGRSCLCC